jgi:hypothetical protein
MNKLFSADNRITDRVIAAEIKSTAFTLIKQQTDKRRLWTSANLFTPIKCLKMIEVPLAECCDYSSPCTIRRSERKLPKIAEGIFNMLIQGVFNITTSESYKYMDPNRYANSKKMNLRDNKHKYWIKNKYLYISDPNVELAEIYAFFTEDVDPTLNSCEDKRNPCYNPLDTEFTLPADLETSMKDIVNNRLRTTYFAHLQDYTPDGKDDAR